LYQIVFNQLIASVSLYFRPLTIIAVVMLGFFALLFLFFLDHFEETVRVLRLSVVYSKVL
jgi:hypothetical protein